ncbi:hypothetical protein pEaSNUABM56_00039 [Erwinia phage pEa_SNUABM_56]|uniref:Uncharacterized protein n=1 Tax=Erwinia phage pEp_SNUABM_01 TaxID=2601643 RepID=A0A5J6DAE0_9CAUD|nr:hypothetical protein HWC63_gp013 [Erwinia phage pEp_SNUABM_01]QEQ94839.1 hypothetical protein pEpSNUABM01_013 [Erwinia phage pEp_SNUABM_01]UYL85084.1 hypothetical protein pEaSNUABM56_00039 [Erwinia phage pEa_SNUABM_56]
MQEPIDIDRICMDMSDRYMLGSIGQPEPTAEEKERLSQLFDEMKEKLKDVDFKVVLPKADYNPIEKRARDFLESSQLWDDRILGADEEYVEVCSDPEVLKLGRQLDQERLEEEKKVVVLGCGPKRVGGAVGVLMAFAQNRATLFDNDFFAVEEEKLPMFDKDYSQVKLRKGRGHNKLKKGKRK